MQLMLNGQTFAHACFGVFCGVAALTCGLASARKDPAHRWLGRIMAGVGVVLAIWCVVLIPSAYHYQKRFNDRREQRQEKNSGSSAPKSVEFNDYVPTTN